MIWFYVREIGSSICLNGSEDKRKVKYGTNEVFDWIFNIFIFFWAFGYFKRQIQRKKSQWTQNQYFGFF